MPKNKFIYDIYVICCFNGLYRVCDDQENRRYVYFIFFKYAIQYSQTIS